jgi:hypothetical protein
MAYRVFAVICALSCVWIVLSLARDPSWTILPGLLIGWSVVDFGSGVVHMLLDYVRMPPTFRADLLFFAPRRDTPEYVRMRKALFGRLNAFWRIAFDFKGHHHSPRALGRRTVRELTRDTLVFGGVPIVIALDLALVFAPPPTWLTAAGLTMAIGAVYIQYFHSVMHRPVAPWPIARLQRVGLVMTAAAHQRHHDDPRRSFAIINGWSNPLLDRIFVVFARLGICRAENLEPERFDAADPAAPEPFWQT